MERPVHLIRPRFDPVSISRVDQCSDQGRRGAVDATGDSQWYFASERGKKAMENEDERLALCRYVWTLVSPNWNFDDATFERTAQAFKNPDYAAVVLYNYRWRIGLIEGESRYDRYEKQLAAQPVIGVPTVTLDAALDPFTPAGDGSSYRGYFTGPYRHRTIADVGHNLPQEAPTAFAQAVIDADHL